MRARWCVILIVAVMLMVTSCGDDGPNLPTQSKDWLALFKRVTLAADEPGHAEIEIEVRTGPDFSEPAPDGTKIHVETTLGSFVGGDRHIETTTHGASGDGRHRRRVAATPSLLIDEQDASARRCRR